MVGHEMFQRTVDRQIADFEGCALLERVRSGAIERRDYHAILGLLFHQVRSSASTFALAGSQLAWERWQAKHYLFQHAHEEATHWQWILDDLAATGFEGTPPDRLPPHPAVAAYVAYNVHVALAQPLARLAIASVLEGIGGRLATTYGRRVAGLLGLRPGQMKFFLGHSETDAVHSRELAEVLRISVDDERQWRELADVAATAGSLYRAIYDAAVRVPEALAP